MNPTLRQMLSRLRNSTVVLGVTSNLISLVMLLGYKLDQSLVMSVVTIICSILALLGIMSNPDNHSGNRFYCPICKAHTLHVDVAEEKLCSICGRATEST